MTYETRLLHYSDEFVQEFHPLPFSPYRFQKKTYDTCDVLFTCVMIILLLMDNVKPKLSFLAQVEFVSTKQVWTSRKKSGIIIFEERPDRSEYDVFWLKGIEDSKTTVTKSSEETIYHHLLNKIAEEPFSLLHDTDKYKRFIEKVKAHIS